MIKIADAFEAFHDASGAPLEAGYVYVGVDGLDPETNPQTVYFDRDLSIEAAQPLRTLGGRIVQDDGTSAANIFVEGAYSIRVKDRNGVTIVASDFRPPFANIITPRFSSRQEMADHLETNSYPAGTSLLADGLLYKTDPTKINAQSALFDLGVDGVVPALDNVTVIHFGAQADVSFDSLPAFNRATEFSAGAAVLKIPAGIYGLNGEWQLPSLAVVEGQPGVTTLRITSSDMSHNVITTTANTRLNSATKVTGIKVSGLIVDGNYTRNAGPYENVLFSGGCCISMANCDGFEIKDCDLINATKHGLDITSSTWNEETDAPTTRPLGGSSQGTVQNCTASGFGDDGITTHYSSNITFTDCSANDSSEHYEGTSAGLEIDDGSYDIRIIGGSFARNTRGVVVKGHSYAPSAQRIRFYGVTCVNNNQNFVTLHDGFDGALDSTSESAYDVLFSGCLSVVPRQKVGTTTDRRAISIGGFSGVHFHDMTIVGVNDQMPYDDPTYSSEASSDVMVAVFGNARSVRFEAMRFSRVEEANNLIQLNDSGKDVALTDITFEECGGLPIQINSDQTGTTIDRIRARTTVTTGTTRVIDATNSPEIGDYRIRDVKQTGYDAAYNLATEVYPVPVVIEDNIVRASGDGDPEGVQPAPRGSLYHRTGATSPGIYQKTGGVNGSTGWVRLATV